MKFRSHSNKLYSTPMQQSKFTPTKAPRPVFVSDGPSSAPPLRALSRLDGAPSRSPPLFPPSRRSSRHCPFRPPAMTTTTTTGPEKRPSSPRDFFARLYGDLEGGGGTAGADAPAVVRADRMPLFADVHQVTAAAAAAAVGFSAFCEFLESFG